MLYEYGKAVAEERRRPRNSGELEKFLRWEYGPGTNMGFLLAERAARVPRRWRRPKLGLAKALKAIMDALSRAPRVASNEAQGGGAGSTPPAR